MKISLIFLSLSLLAFRLLSQETDGTAYTANLGVTVTDGNSNTEQLNLGFDAKKVTEKNEVTLKAFYDYGRTTKTEDGQNTKITNQDKSKLEVQANQVISETLYAYVALSAERDQIAGIDRRVTGGPGLGHYFRRDDTLTLSVEGGLVWVFEKQDGTTDDYAAFRLAHNGRWSLGEGAQLRQEIEWITDIEDQENYYINARLIADASLTDTLGLRVELRDTYNNQPGAGKEKNDITVLSGVTVSW